MEEKKSTITNISNLKLRDSINGEEYSFINPANINITDGYIAFIL